MTTDSPASQLNAMIGRFDPAVRKMVRAARAKLRKKLPAAVELIYDNYNALAIAYGASERRGDWIVSLAVYARGVNLYFIYGVALPAIADLLAAAVAETDTPLPKRGKGHTVIKAISPNQRRRRT